MSRFVDCVGRFCYYDAMMEQRFSFTNERLGVKMGGSFVTCYFPLFARLPLRRIAEWVYLVLLYLAGVIHWVWFFAFAKFVVKDWELAGIYHGVLRDAFLHRLMPYLSTYGGHYTDHFLGFPETPLSPQFVLLTWLPDDVFHRINILLLFTISFYGLLRLRRAFGLGLLPFTFLFLFFSFNGYLVSRVGIGHFMWYGYFFLPFFHLIVLRMERDPVCPVFPLQLALILFVMWLQGSFHLVFWCFLYLALVVCFNPVLWRAMGTCFIVSAGLNLFRLLPAALSLNGIGLPFFFGFPSFSALLDALTRLKLPTEWVIALPNAALGWWEVDCYVGMTGLCLLVWFGIWRRLRLRGEEGEPPESFSPLNGPMLIMLLLSCAFTYSLLAWLPGFQAERISSRFIIVPLTTLSVLAAIQMQRYLVERPLIRGARSLLAILLLFFTVDLYRHSSEWTVANVERLFYQEWHRYYEPTFVKGIDFAKSGISAYVWSVRISLVISVLVLIGVLWRLWQLRADRIQSSLVAN